MPRRRATGTTPTVRISASSATTRTPAQPSSAPARVLRHDVGAVAGVGELVAVPAARPRLGPEHLLLERQQQVDVPSGHGDDGDHGHRPGTVSRSWVRRARRRPGAAGRAGRGVGPVRRRRSGRRPAGPGRARPGSAPATGSASATARRTARRRRPRPPRPLPSARRPAGRPPARRRGRRPVAGPVDLVASRIGGDEQVPDLGAGGADRVERADAVGRDADRVGERGRGDEPDPQAGERSGSGADDDGVHLARRDAGVVQAVGDARA